MKRSFYLLPLMAGAALSLTLAACDDKKQEDTAVTEQTTVTTEEAPVAPAVAATIDASNATAYATAEGARTGAVFVTLYNPQTAIDKLLGATSDKASLVEIHQSYVDDADGTMQMRKVEGVDILPSQQVELKPGGYHIMLIDLAQPLVEGQTFNVVLKFQNAGDVTVPVMVTAPGASAGDASAAMPSDTGEHMHDDGSMVAPSTTTDVPVTEAPSDEATPEPTPMPADQSAVPADEPVTDVPATDEQPAQ